MSDQPSEPLDEFRPRARSWIESNLRRGTGIEMREGPDAKRHNKDLQAKIYDAGFAGYAVPEAYGGIGLTLDHQRVWAEETRGYETPLGYMVSIGMMMPTLLDHGTEAVKKRHIPKMLRGEEVWIQLLSEPSGGSDMAGALTRATRQDDSYRINGSKMWSSDADVADYGLCLARCDWDAPKHQGLGMFAIPLDAPGVTINPITPVSGGKAHFFIEYFEDVEIPQEYVVGRPGEGWTVAQRLLFHERNATVGIAYGYGLLREETGGGVDGESGSGPRRINPVDLARKRGVLTDPVLADQIADSYVAELVARQLGRRINTGMQSGKLQGHWGSLVKLGLGMDAPERAELVLAVAGADGVIWAGDGPGGEAGQNWLRVRGISISGGSNEIQRNIVSERLLGLPREAGDDKTVPFNELMKRRGRS